ncbi:uncharacterized protein V6R79_012193 [Siganus canaliculatus]
MSLADQSQQLFPTSVQVTVHQARSLRVKGKNGTNDAYAIFQLAKDKFSTSVAEKSVAPVWKEEASFDLPLFHPSNAERCTLYIIVMHRAQVGLDKFLGQAVVNLLDLYDNKSRSKTDWFKLVDKSGKEDKARGEVLLDIQFMRNNMSASMFDLSMQDKPRSRMSKFKDKVRGKKKEGFSDSASAIVPSVSQVITDSEGEADAQSLSQSPGVKKKSKLKTLFAPKSNLQRNISQSMSTLGTLPEKNSSLSGSRSSGLNVGTPEAKKKFKFLGHKRTGSSDSKVSQGPFSLLGRSKQSNSDLNSLCINGNHVYAEETESKSGSTLSLNSSGPGSVEDVRKHMADADSSPSVPVPSIQVESDQALLEQQRHQEEEERRQEELRRLAEAKRLEEEEKYRLEAKRMQEEEERRLQEEQEFKRRFLEDEAKRKRQKEEEEEERRRQEEERQRLEEERRRAEEQKQQEEASMSDRLTSLFGMIRRKEEKKEEVQQQRKEEPSPEPVSQRSTNPFYDTTVLSSDPAVSASDPQPSSRNPQVPSAMVFLNRTAKVSAVKPRFDQSLESDPADFQTPSQLNLFPATSESIFPSVPPESPETFSSLHSSTAAPDISQSPSGSPFGSTENLSSAGSSPTMSDKKRRAPLPPAHGLQNGGSHTPVREIHNPAYVEVDGSQPGKTVSLPLPDYETLFPQRRHGVQGHTRWDHIIAEVNQRNRDTPELMGPEMSVDGPMVHDSSLKSTLWQESHYQTQPQETNPVLSKRGPAPLLPETTTPPHPVSVADSSQRQNQNIAYHSPSAKADVSSSGSLSVIYGDAARRALKPPSAPRRTSKADADTKKQDDERNPEVTAPTVKPRQRISGKGPEQQESSLNPADSAIQTLPSSSFSSMDRLGRQPEERLEDFDPFPSTELLPKDPWAQLKQSQGSDLQDVKLEDQGMTADDFENIFNQQKKTDPFAVFNGRNSNAHSEDGQEEDSKEASPAFQRRNSQRRSRQSSPRSDKKTLKAPEEPAFDATVVTVRQNLSARDTTSDSITANPQPDVSMPSHMGAGEDLFGAKSFTGTIASASSEPLPIVLEEAESQAESLSGGKTLLRAWVSPSEVQPVSAQNSSGGGLAFTQRRPHPVKPMSTADNQHPINAPAVKEIKAWDNMPGKTQMGDSVESGPYTQLTQEELITLVVKQQTDLSKKDDKITELEEYIDKLLVRVIDEKPSLLQSLAFGKPV